jgi:hypothetical protein
MALDIEDRVAIAQVLARYCHAADYGMPDDMRPLFHPDMRCRVLDSGHVFEGIEQFVDLMRSRLDRRDSMRHLSSAVCIEAAAAGAVSESYLQLMVQKDGKWETAKIGRYRDTWEKSPAGWVIRERIVE